MLSITASARAARVLLGTLLTFVALGAGACEKEKSNGEGSTGDTTNGSGGAGGSMGSGSGGSGDESAGGMAGAMESGGSGGSSSGGSSSGGSSSGGSSSGGSSGGSNAAGGSGGSTNTEPFDAWAVFEYFELSEPAVLVALDAEGNTRELSPTPGQYGVSNSSVSPDGRYVAFESDALTPAGSTWVASTDGTELFSISTLAVRTKWSPLGNKLLIDDYDLSIVNADGSDEVELGTHDISRNGFGAEWSPDGMRVAWLSQDLMGGAQLMVGLADGSDAPVLEPIVEGLDVNVFRWSPTSDALLVRGELAARVELMAVDAVSGETTTLATDMEFDEIGIPAFSHDGSFVAFPSLPKDASNWVLSVASTDGMLLDTYFEDAYTSVDHAVWSPTKNELAVVTRSGDLHLADNSGSTRISSDSTQAWNAMWSLDGSRIAHAGELQVYTLTASGAAPENPASFTRQDPPLAVQTIVRVGAEGFAFVREGGEVSVLDEFGARVVTSVEQEEEVLNTAFAGSVMNQVVLQALKEESASAPALDVAALILLGPEDVATTLLEIEAPDGKTAIGGFALLGSPGGSTLHQSNAYEGDATARR